MELNKMTLFVKDLESLLASMKKLAKDNGLREK